MLVGFVSLAMALLATPVSKICIRSALYDKWTPCHISERPDSGVWCSCEWNAGRWTQTQGFSRGRNCWLSGVGYQLQTSRFTPAVGKALHNWHKGARKMVKIIVLFSFRNKRNSSTIEEKSLKSKDSNSKSSSLSLNMGIFMEESSIKREGRGAAFGKDAQDDKELSQ